jgi:hypothetical protein
VTRRQPSGGDQPPDAMLFGPLDLFHVRGLVKLRAQLAGLSDERTDGLVLAVHEIAAHAFTLGEEPAWLVVNSGADHVLCEIRETDRDGAADERAPDRVPRLAEPVGGSAIRWRVARLMADEVRVTADSTSVLLLMRLTAPARRVPPGRSRRR